ncbi:retrovirus-related pol polyprotein from transposon TNT 1-94 [Tanacetum coccineum]
MKVLSSLMKHLLPLSTANGVVERQNHTLIEAARTMLIYAKAPLFLWVKAVAIACYTQNLSMIRRRHGKTPYELLHNKPPGLSRRIETIHVDFDELTALAFEHSSSGPALHEMTPAIISSGLVPNPHPSTPFVPPSRTDWDMLFQPLFDEFLNPSPSVDLPSSKSLLLLSNDPYFGVPILEIPSDQSSSSGSIHTIQALFCYYDAFLTAVEPKTYKDALTQACWIEAMQEELNEFERLEVWELVPRPDKVMRRESIFEDPLLQDAKIRGITIFLAFAGTYDMSVYQMDVKTAFLNGNLREEVYVSQRMDFSKGLVDPTLFIHRDGKELLLVQIYVDDIIFAASTPELLDTPMVEKSKLDKDKRKAVDPSHYRGMIGTLLYLTASRPDLQFAICMCARYQARPIEKHLNAIKRIFQYLKGTVHWVLWYPKDSSIALTAFADVDHAGCQDTRHSTSRSMQLLGDRLVSWSSKRQKSDAISSTKVAYIALSGCCAQILWIQQPPILTPATTTSSSLQNLPNFASLFGFDYRLKALEDNFSELRQTNQYAEALSSIPGIVDQYLANKMQEAVDVAVQLKYDRIREESNTANQQFLDSIDEGMKKIIKEQVKKEVSKITPKIEKLVIDQLESEVLVRSSKEANTSHAVAANLSELELKKILIDKMEANNSINRSDIQRQLYKALVDAYEADKILLDTYGDTVTIKRPRDGADDDQEPSAGTDRGSKRRRSGKEPASTSAPSETTTTTAGKTTTTGSKTHKQSASQSAPVEETMQTTDVFEAPAHKEFETGVHDEQAEEEV